MTISKSGTPNISQPARMDGGYAKTPSADTVRMKSALSQQAQKAAADPLAGAGTLTQVSSAPDISGVKPDPTLALPRWKEVSIGTIPVATAPDGSITNVKTLEASQLGFKRVALQES
ncbi:MAG: hypothetical protein AAF619_02525 [Pseudomonadota bacterium]